MSWRVRWFYLGSSFVREESFEEHQRASAEHEARDLYRLTRNTPVTWVVLERVETNLDTGVQSITVVESFQHSTQDDLRQGIEKELRWLDMRRDYFRSDIEAQHVIDRLTRRLA